MTEITDMKTKEIKTAAPPRLRTNLHHLYLKAELTDDGIAIAQANGIFVHGNRTITMPLWEFGLVFGYPALKVRRVFVDDQIEVICSDDAAPEFDPSDPDSIKNETATPTKTKPTE
jgi:hypothetical protein